MALLYATFLNNKKNIEIPRTQVFELSPLFFSKKAWVLSNMLLSWSIDIREALVIIRFNSWYLRHTNPNHVS